MIDTKELRRRALDGDLAAMQEIILRLAAAESECLEQARLNGMGSEREAALLAKLEAAEKERDALRAKIEAMERQEPARLVTATAYRWRYRGAIKWQYGELTEETVMAAKEHNHEVQPLYALPGAQPAPSVPEGFSREDLEAVAAGLDGYEKTVNVGNVTGEGDDHLESTTAYAARFIRAMLAAPEAKP